LKLVGTDEKTIYEETKKLLTDKAAYQQMSEAKNPYGDGFASKRIVDELLKRFGK
ncbi:MAG: UDP-N-acetylglucosamine 2-epimerase (non-hydrolyzing), partial [Mollicutes bacterium]|nr:UDP-N-acetylglucosamine 2-epimerase (non-hydrolyzing) [Mollicutes bacterium]